MTGKKWYFNDCMVVEMTDSFAVYVDRNGLYGVQEVVPSSMKDFEECRKRLDEGESPLWTWEDGAGKVVGYGMKGELNDIVNFVRKGRYMGGTVEVGEGTDLIIYALDDKLLVMYLCESFGDDFPTDDEVLETVTRYAIINEGDKIPKYYDEDILFEVEDDDKYFNYGVE